MTGERLTERLRLVPIGAEHVDDLWRLHQESRVADYWGAWSRDDALRYAARQVAWWESQRVGKWIAYDRANGDLVGRGGLSRALVDGEERLELGWTVIGHLWGRGFATEIGRAGLDFAFDDLGADEVVAFTETSNERSSAVMERLAMRYARNIVHLGKPFVLYVMTRADDERLRASDPTTAY